MKKIVIGFGVLVALATGLLMAGLLYANSLVQARQGEIKQLLSNALGAPVSFSGVQIRIIPSVQLEVNNLSIADSSGGTSGASVESLQAEAALMPLLSKQIIFKSIILQSPKITLVKTPTGMTIKGLSSQDKTGTPAASPPNVPSSGSTSSASHYSLAIERILVSDGSLHIPGSRNSGGMTVMGLSLDAGVSVRDSSIQIPSLVVSGKLDSSHPLTLSASDFSFSRDSGVLAFSSATLKGLAGEMHASGSLNTQSNSGSFKLHSDGLHLQTLSPQVKNSLPVLSAINSSGVIKLDGLIALHPSAAPTLDLRATPVDVGITLSPTHHLSRINGVVSVAGPATGLSIKSSGLALLINTAPVMVDTEIHVSTKGTEIPKLSVRGFGGQIDSPGSITSDAFRTKTTASNIDLTSLFNVISQPSLANTFTGKLKSLTATVSGATSGAVSESLRVDGALMVTDGLFKGNNLPMAVLSQISSIPIFGGILNGGVPDKYKGGTNGKDTAIHELSGSFSVAQKVTTLTGTKVVSDMCSFTVDGTIAHDGDLDISSTFTFSPDLSMGLVKSLKGLNRALNSAQQLVVPVMISGIPPMLVILPDVSKLLTGTITNLPTEALGIVGGVLGLGPSEPDDSDTGQERRTDQNKKGSLNRIFGF